MSTDVDIAYLMHKVKELTIVIQELHDKTNRIEDRIQHDMTDMIDSVILNNKELTVNVPYIDFGIDEETKLPVRKKEGDCGYDAYALEEVTIAPHSGAKVPIGIGLIIPEPFGVKAETRSGNFINGLNIGSAWVDRGYRGQIHCLVQNITDEPITIHKGDRPCAIELELTFNMNLVPAKEYYSPEEYEKVMNTERGSSGFGSSRKIIK